MNVCECDDFSGIAAVFLFNDVVQGDAAQIFVDGFVQVFPQVVGEAGGAVVAVGFAFALGGVERVFCCRNDLRNVDLRGGRRQNIAAARAAKALDQLRAPQLAEQLFQIGKRDALPLADGAEFDSAVSGVHGQIDHRRDGESAFGGQSHGLCLYGFYHDGNFLISE